MAITLNNTDINGALYFSGTNVGIGISTPGNKLNVVDSTSCVVESKSTNGFASFRATASGINASYMFFNNAGGEKGRISSYDDGALTFSTGTAATERVRIDQLGKLGIGTNAPAQRLHVYDGVSDGTVQLGGTGSTGYYSQIDQHNNDLKLVANGDQQYRVALGTNDGSGNILFYTATGTTGNTERVRITAAGQFLIGSTTYSYGYNGTNSWTFQGSIAINHAATTTTINRVVFNNPNGQVGYINTTATTTIYGTGSDYRLKENIQPMQNALGIVAQLKPVTYTWKADGSSGQGFIAHELQEIIPDAVSGEKDAINPDGSIKTQGIDTSFIVATLTAAIQELNAKVDALQSELNTIKGN